MTQEQIVLNHLKKAGSITGREARDDYSIQSLTRRITELKRMGYSIASEWRSHPITRQRYVRYTLEG
jgi:hypothetical protein